MPTVARAACAENEIDVLGDGTQCETAKFAIRLMLYYDPLVFNFNISAQGTFYVDCGDGGTLSGTGVSGKTITRTDTTEATYTCTYQYDVYDQIRFGGMATGYNTTNVSTIRFNENPNVIEAISGSLGAIFPTIGTSQPRFISTFEGCGDWNIDFTIPEELFTGIVGAPVSNMFYRTFANSLLYDSIPEGLFSGISGAPAESMFAMTFSGCHYLTGSIPEGLFSGISGAPAESMFLSTFSDCNGLSGSIPENLFGNLSGEGAKLMFLGTFSFCSELSGYVPKNIFENITSTGTSGTNGMFEETNLYTECPCGSMSAETGWGATLVDGRAVCQANPAEHIYNDVCVGDCAAGITKIKTSTGLEFPLFDTKPTTPALHIQHNGTICYTPMELGDGGANSMNIMSGGAAYHLGTLE